MSEFIYRPPIYIQLPRTRGDDSTNLRSTMARASRTATPPPLPTVPTLEGEELARAQRWLEDKVVRAVREARHCEEALAIMDKIFKGPSTGDTFQLIGRRNSYVDSDGKDCWNNEWRDADGYNRNGIDQYGRDKDGYDKDGYDIGGYNRDGKDADGLARDDPARFQYDDRGYDKDGFTVLGMNRLGLTREQAHDPERFKFDRHGYDVDGYNRDGYNRVGGRRPGDRDRVRF